jgi:hypothetical protein
LKFLTVYFPLENMYRGSLIIPCLLLTLYFTSSRYSFLRLNDILVAQNSSNMKI